MEKKDKCKCPICDTIGKWENVDQYRDKPHDMHICTNCGFVFYPNKYMTEDEAKAYYKNDYRKPPQYGNAVTGQRKLHMHSHFLNDVLQEWKDNKKENPVICDVGAAYGMFLNWIRSYFPKGEFYGTEYTESYRRNAWHEYKLKLDHDFDKTKKYDLISSFKVAEHQLDVDKRLREYTECLSDGGYMYISVPTWFRRMTNFGSSGFSIEYYYHPDHINVWTEKLFETLLKKVGLEIIKKDTWMYDETYLCKRNDSLMDEGPEYEDYNEIKEKMSNIKKAWDCYNNQDFDGAVNHFPYYFEAWKARYEINRKNAHEDQGVEPYDYIVKNYIDPCLAACYDSLDALGFAVDLNMRYERYEVAIAFIKKALEVRPNNGIFLHHLSHCYRQMAKRENRPVEQVKLLTEARNVNKYLRDIDMSLKQEATNWTYHDNAHIPIN